MGKIRNFPACKFQKNQKYTNTENDEDDDHDDDLVPATINYAGNLEKNGPFHQNHRIKLNKLEVNGETFPN